jgi:hypothetical protein
VPQKTTLNKTVALTKLGLSGQIDSGALVPLDRVYLEMSTICVGFRLSSGAAGNCEAGGDMDIMIDDFANSRYSINALNGIADLGMIDAATAKTAGANFSSRASLVLGHTYAVQLSSGKIGILKFSNSLTPRQLAAEANRKFGLNGIRIVKKLGFDSTGASQPGDVAGQISVDALMYFDITFRP